MSFYPTLESLLAEPDQDSLLVLRRAPRSSTGLLTLFVILVAAIIVFAIKTADAPMSRGEQWSAMIRVAMAFPAVVLGEIVRRYFNDVYLVGRDKITHYRGRVSFHFATPSIRNIDLRAITVAQGIIGRIFDFGDVALATAAQEGPEIILVGVRSPHELAQLIDQLRQKSQHHSFANAKEHAYLHSIQND